MHKQYLHKAHQLWRERAGPDLVQGLLQTTGTPVYDQDALPARAEEISGDQS